MSHLISIYNLNFSLNLNLIKVKIKITLNLKHYNSEVFPLVVHITHILTFYMHYIY
jgi:hypothetical protein